MTELSPVATVSPAGEPVIGSAGTLVANTKAKVHIYHWVFNSSRRRNEGFTVILIRCCCNSLGSNCCFFMTVIIMCRTFADIHDRQ